MKVSAVPHLFAHGGGEEAEHLVIADLLVVEIQVQVVLHGPLEPLCECVCACVPGGGRGACQAQGSGIEVT